jgi:chemotaxis protein methyltransferase CheR
MSEGLAGIHRVGLSDAEYERLADLVRKWMGVSLEERNRPMVASRVQKLLRSTGLSSVSAYCDLLERQGDPAAIGRFVDRITTHHTYFYRDADQFEAYRREYLPEILRRIESGGNRDLRVWCAAASTGEEPYTLAIIAQEVLGNAAPQWKTGVLATDISVGVLEQARRGIFAVEPLARLPEAWQQRWFRPLDAERVQAVKALRDEVVFRRFNLLDPLPFKQPFHFIFCRNVLIYFNPAMRREVLSRLRDKLAPGGYLFLGSSESLVPQEYGLERARASVFRRPLHG